MRSDVHILPCTEYNRPVTPSSYFPVKDCGPIAPATGLKSIHWQLSEWLIREPDVNEQLRKLCRAVHPDIDCRSAYHDPPSITQGLAELLGKVVENPELDHVRFTQRVVEL